MGGAEETWLLEPSKKAIWRKQLLLHKSLGGRMKQYLHYLLPKKRLLCSVLEHSILSKVYAMVTKSQLQEVAELGITQGSCGCSHCTHLPSQAAPKTMDLLRIRTLHIYDQANSPFSSRAFFLKECCQQQ